MREIAIIFGLTFILATLIADDMSVALIVSLSIGLVLLLARFFYVSYREANERRNGTFARRFVYIEEDGSARMLTSDEINYLNTEFHSADGARPYIKQSYKQVTPDGKVSGFLESRHLPRKIRNNVRHG